MNLNTANRHYPNRNSKENRVLKRQGIQKLQDKSKQPNVCVIRVPERELRATEKPRQEMRTA